jgi:hypothetical protein
MKDKAENTHFLDFYTAKRFNFVSEKHKKTIHKTAFAHGFFIKLVYQIILLKPCYHYTWYF